MTKQVNEWRALSAQQWVKEKILGSTSGSSALNVKFSEKSQQRLIDNIDKMREKRNALFIEKLELKAKEGKATEHRIIHLYVKLMLFKLIIELGKKVFKKSLKILNALCTSFLGDII